MDDESLRAARLLRRENMSTDDCPFCSLPEARIGISNDLALTLPDQYPVTQGHTLAIPRRHIADFFELSAEEVKAILELLGKARERLVADDPSIEGFNVGINSGEAAGQTVMHCHVHLIPRRPDDVADPRGGVRHVIPGKGDYLTGMT